MATSLRILIIDDSPRDAERILRALRRAGFQPTWKRVDTAGTLTAALGPGASQWDAVTCDDAMPQLRFLSALQIVRAVTPGMPFIVMSNAAGELPAGNGARRGGYEIVSRDRLQELPTLIARALYART